MSRAFEQRALDLLERSNIQGKNWSITFDRTSIAEPPKKTGMDQKVLCGLAIGLAAYLILWKR